MDGTEAPPQRADAILAPSDAAHIQIDCPRFLGDWGGWGGWGGLGAAWGRLWGTSGATLTLLLFRSLQLGVCLFMPRPGGIRSGTAPRATERMTDRSTKRASERAKVVRVPSGKVDEVTIHYTSSLFAFALYLLPSPRRFPPPQTESIARHNTATRRRITYIQLHGSS